VNAVAERSTYRLRKRELCSSCGASGRFGQLICLGCGERMALRHRSPSRRPFIVAAAVIAVTGAAALAMVIEGIGRDEAPAGSAAQPAVTPDPQVTEREAAEAGRRRSAARARRATLAAGGWPATQSAFTVVLLNTGDRASAERFARTVSAAGDDAGVIKSDDHPGLGTGLFIVFAGTYDDEAEAGAAAARLGESYSGAYTQFVEAPKAASSGEPARPPSP